MNGFHMDGATTKAGSEKRSVNKDWLRALQLTAAVEADQSRILGVAFEEVARDRGDAAAVIDNDESLSFAQFAARANRYARWGLARGLGRNDVVALLMGNRADYAAIWLGLTRIGVVVALLNGNLPAPSLAHCLGEAKACCIIADQEHFEAACAAAGLADPSPEIVTFEEGSAVQGGLRKEVAKLSGEALGPSEEREVVLSDRALYIFTSGTTGLPKAAVVTHRRLMNWSLWFSGLADAGPADRMYNCLPMYHSVGGVVAVWSTLLAGGSVVLRPRFSASNFWRDVAEQQCTMFQYIGELCRYLLTAPDREAQQRHKLRLALGNGLRGDIWTPFQSRFGIPRIIEFYAATESNFSLYNVEGEPGAIGRVPAFLAQRFPVALVAFDEGADAPARGADGRCIRCATDEPGEAIARIDLERGSAAAFDGYVNRKDSEKKILRDVFEPGDLWMRSGDLMRKDARGFYFFVDRIGDSFRWKGENVSTFEVAQYLRSFGGVLDAAVYGVAVPGREGRAGMAALAVEGLVDFAALARHMEASLPVYARPLFLRLGGRLEMTGTFKHKAQALAAEGFDPRRIGDPLYFAAPGTRDYVRLDKALYDRICSGDIRL
ncbi:long-chain-acyl-CoA synthetase [Methylocystis heyeri]|uniref:Long-chain-acyl-CoA synthetase n=1 Tax=Methylocystis heyeri TaxID=391905 RepID=A0A6B8KF56_9HYPH|nr:long-chain-acyl-CoA synthetase [Methylocystis heyeri]QGM47104.1 long-chain-acyl-CoA synthetase [Methylocystis heyeri]